MSKLFEHDKEEDVVEVRDFLLLDVEDRNIRCSRVLRKAISDDDSSDEDIRGGADSLVDDDDDTDRFFFFFDKS